MEVQVTYDNAILGSGIFWEGDKRGIKSIKNVVVKIIAKRTFQDGKVHKMGMWKAEPINPPLYKKL